MLVLHIFNFVQGCRTVDRLFPEFLVWLLAHYELQSTAIHYVIIRYIAFAVWFAVQEYFLDINVLFAVVYSFYCECFSIADIYLYSVKAWTDGLTW